MDVIIKLIVMIISQYTYISLNHHVVHTKKWSPWKVGWAKEASFTNIVLFPV